MELPTLELLILAIGAMGLGIMLLVYGGNWTIDAAVYIARKLGISPLVVGFTIVAFGTSLPELIVSVNANLNGSPGIALGNVIGSNIANILLVVGCSAAVTTLVVQPRKILSDILMMNIATILMILLFLNGVIGWGLGAAMIAVLITYVLFQYSMAMRGDKVIEEVEDPEFTNNLIGLIFLILGLIFIALGAEFLVRGAKVSATILGVPEAVIALSLIALGTSLPELSTCIIAAMKKQGDIIIGNVIGSNVFNILMIIGVTALFKPIHVMEGGSQLVDLDMWITFGVTLAFSVWLLLFKQVGRVLGSIFVLGYVAYILAIYMIYLT